jgi:predicted transcriptional regulator
VAEREYGVDEAARVLGLSPARVRQMLRSGELEGERREERIEGVLGPWRIPAQSVRAFQERRAAREATADTVGGASQSPPGEGSAITPSEASELLSEGVRQLREKVEDLLGELGRLESRLEAAEIQETTLRKSLERESQRAERERADGLRAELDAERARRNEEPRGAWCRVFGR